ncbi:MAG: hypothetical protein KKF52_00445 [Nanoarchaeota archaeon]|nr:hypothetical protein [Nanoarchaeota archaeon]
MYPIEKFYQVMHIKLLPKHLVHAENLSTYIANLPSNRYYIVCFLARAMEAESMWGRFIAWKVK